MVKQRLVHVVGAGNYHTSEHEIFTSRGNFKRCELPEECDVLVLMGGIDINPKLYNEKPIYNGYYNDGRDALEIEAVYRAPQAFKFGICRGGQLLNVLAGGSLWQDVNKHHGSHLIRDVQTNRNIMTSSVHHQAFRVTDAAEIIAVCQLSTHKVSQFKHWERGMHTEDEQDIEICYYPTERYLCIQGHPEYGDRRFADYCFELMMKRI